MSLGTSEELRFYTNLLKNNLFGPKYDLHKIPGPKGYTLLGARRGGGVCRAHSRVLTRCPACCHPTTPPNAQATSRRSCAPTTTSRRWSGPTSTEVSAASPWAGSTSCSCQVCCVGCVLLALTLQPPAAAATSRREAAAAGGGVGSSRARRVCLHAVRSYAHATDPAEVARILGRGPGSLPRKCIGYQVWLLRGWGKSDNARAGWCSTPPQAPPRAQQLISVAPLTHASALPSCCCLQFFDMATNQ
jgi:hypothetical protein